MKRTPLDFYCEVVYGVNDDGTQYKYRTEDDTDDNDVCEVRLLSCRKKSVNCQSE